MGVLRRDIMGRTASLLSLVHYRSVEFRSAPGFAATAPIEWDLDECAIVWTAALWRRIGATGGGEAQPRQNGHAAPFSSCRIGFMLPHSAPMSPGSEDYDRVRRQNVPPPRTAASERSPSLAWAWWRENRVSAGCLWRAESERGAGRRELTPKLGPPTRSLGWAASSTCSKKAERPPLQNTLTSLRIGSWRTTLESAASGWPKQHDVSGNPGKRFRWSLRVAPGYAFEPRGRSREQLAVDLLDLAAALSRGRRRQAPSAPIPVT